MSYELAFEALNDGEYRRAVDLLAQAAEETSFASDMINHAYTLALYRAGEHSRLADVAYRVGLALVATDPASAMDYFQRAVRAGLDRSRQRQIGEVYEEWAADRRGGKLEAPVHHVGHVVSELSGAHSRTAYMRMLCRSLNDHGLKSTILTTEAATSWFHAPSKLPRSESAAIASIPSPAIVGSPEGDFIERSDRIARTIRESSIQVLFFHDGLSDQIAARVASLGAAPVQVLVNHEVDIDADIFDAVVHLRRNTRERTPALPHPSAWIPPASDIESRLTAEGFQNPQTLAIESAESVSATFGSISGSQESGFVRVLIEILKRFPRHFHLFAGSGSEVRAVRSLLHSEGVLPRVRFLGQIADPAPLLGAIDLYLAPFPSSEQTGILEVMGAGKPIVVMRAAPDSEFNSAAELIGYGPTSAHNNASYIQIASRLLTDPAARVQEGDAMRERFIGEFRPERLGERYLEFMGQLR